MKISHRPDGTSVRIGWTRPSHPLKSPTTLTRFALGAHTPKCTPACSAVRDRPRAQAIERAHVRAFRKQMLIEIGEHRTIAIRIVQFRLVAVAPAHAIPIIEPLARGAVDPRLEHAFRVKPDHRDGAAARPLDDVIADACGRNVRIASPDAPFCRTSCGPSTAKGSACIPVASVSMCAWSERSRSSGHVRYQGQVSGIRYQVSGIR